MNEINKIFGIEEKKDIPSKEIHKNQIDKRKTICSIFAIIGILLFIIGLVSLSVIKTPSSEIDYEQSNKYVGGDAYNLIIASSIRGGEISAAATHKATAVNCILIGILLLCLSLIILFNDNKVIEKE